MDGEGGGDPGVPSRSVSATDGDSSTSLQTGKRAEQRRNVETRGRRHKRGKRRVESDFSRPGNTAADSLPRRASEGDSRNDHVNVEGVESVNGKGKERVKREDVPKVTGKSKKETLRKPLRESSGEGKSKKSRFPHFRKGKLRVEKNGEPQTGISGEPQPIRVVTTTATDSGGDSSPHPLRSVDYWGRTDDSSSGDEDDAPKRNLSTRGREKSLLGHIRTSTSADPSSPGSEGDSRSRLSFPLSGSDNYEAELTRELQRELYPVLLANLDENTRESIMALRDRGDLAGSDSGLDDDEVGELDYLRRRMLEEIASRHQEEPENHRKRSVLTRVGRFVDRAIQMRSGHMNRPREDSLSIFNDSRRMGRLRERMRDGALRMLDETLIPPHALPLFREYEQAAGLSEDMTELVRRLEEDEATYEDLLQLEQFNVSKAASEEVVSSLASGKYTAGLLSKENSSCPICLEDYEEGDGLRELPCFHVFHSSCVGEWLLLSRCCPICRIDLHSQPRKPPGVIMSTPVVKEGDAPCPPLLSEPMFSIRIPEMALRTALPNLSEEGL